eukprot:jgi/Undpi1/2935/HiC_scaffold_14.g06312.m1
MPAEGTGATGDGASVGARFPSVTLKLAMDRNGAVDDMSEGPKRFTSQASLDAVHRIRRDCDAVLVGVGTVVRDDPSLTVRRVPLKAGQDQPTRVVLDRTLRLPGSGSCSILRDGYASVIFYSAGCEETEARAADLAAEVKALRATESSPWETITSGASVDFVGLPPRAPGEGVPLAGVLEALSKRGINHMLVEGGPSVGKGFLWEELVDRAIIVRAPVEFPRPVPSGMTSRTLEMAGLKLVGCTKWGDDEVECWTRPGLEWPGGRIDCWP